MAERTKATVLKTTRAARRDGRGGLGRIQGDSYDDALAETINGFYKSSGVPPRGCPVQ